MTIKSYVVGLDSEAKSEMLKARRRRHSASERMERKQSYRVKGRNIELPADKDSEITDSDEEGVHEHRSSPPLIAKVSSWDPQRQKRRN